MLELNTPILLWYFCYKYTTDIISLCSTGRFGFLGRTPYKTVMNYTPDVSEYAAFSWFQGLWLDDERPKNKQLCRWLGPDHGVGQVFCS